MESQMDTNTFNNIEDYKLEYRRLHSYSPDINNVSGGQFYVTTKKETSGPFELDDLPKMTSRLSQVNRNQVPSL